MKKHHSKAKQHHGHAGKCMEDGDYAGAMHHTGHMLSSLRRAAKGDEEEMEEPMGEESELAETPPEPSGGPSGLRSRLARMGTRST